MTFVGYSRGTFYKCTIPGLFFVYLQSFSIKQYKFYNKLTWKFVSQYLVLGFELTTSWRESPPTTTRPGLQSQQFCVLQWKYFSYPYHLSSAVFNLQNLSELRHLFLLYKWSCENNLNLIYFLICILFNFSVYIKWSNITLKYRNVRFAKAILDLKNDSNLIIDQRVEVKQILEYHLYAMLK